MPRAYKRIYVPVDNSGYSFAAIDLAVDLATKFDACIVGSHVFAAGVSDSYLDLMEECCRTAAVKFERKTLDGRHHRMILEDIEQNHYDLVIMGALGAGAVDESQLGSVAERVVRGAGTDVLIVKDLIPDPDGAILVAVDGSPQSLEALAAAVEFGRSTGRPVEGIVVGEGHVSGKASVALESARLAAAAEGIEIELTVTEGKPFDRIVKLCREKRPWLLVIGKTGADTEEDDDVPLGSTTANLLRLAPCNVLVTPGVRAGTGRLLPADRTIAALPVPATGQRMLQWTEDAERLLEDVPGEQRPDVIRTVEEGARRMGITIITAETIDKVMLGYIDS
ncbi:MAG TPA: universal stress protein [Patescibacteria group bacterium]|jgi:nucleotide-binding universal stress UspA family protein|nr:universal stress protein [Patescibacteria group bacterium]